MTDHTLPTNAPPGLHLLAKPSGSTCNIDCMYCFFLSRETLCPNEKNRMSQATLEIANHGMETSPTANKDATEGLCRPCPCGSGQKFCFYHGNCAPRSPGSGPEFKRRHWKQKSDAISNQ